MFFQNLTTDEIEKLEEMLNHYYMIAIENEHGCIAYTNSRLQNLFDMTETELLDISPDLLWENIVSYEVGTTSHGEWVMYLKRGEKVLCKGVVIQIHSFSIAKKTLYIFHTISREHSSYEWRNLALFDDLTKLPNERKLNEMLQTYQQLNNQSISCLFIDLNEFKSINDTYGHFVGDRVLVEFATFLKKVFSNINSVFRKSGDEFVVLLVGFDKKNTLAILKELLSNLQNTILIKDIKLNVSISIGISLFPNDSSSLEEVVQKADIALYAAKKSKNNSYLFYQSGMEKG